MFTMFLDFDKEHNDNVTSAVSKYGEHDNAVVSLFSFSFPLSECPYVIFTCLLLVKLIAKLRWCERKQQRGVLM